MSPRYYISTAIFIGGLTFAISYWKNKQTGKEIFMVFVKVLTDGHNCWWSFVSRLASCLFRSRPVWFFSVSIQLSDFSDSMILIMVLSFFVISYFMGMLVHSAWMYEDKGSVQKDSRFGWILCMIAGTCITGWMFYYGYYVNFVR